MILEKARPVILWMLQLSNATAKLESLGFAHRDIIKPQNILVDDDQDALKLVDLDHAVPIGSDVDVGFEPYVRVHRLGEGGGTCGIAGRETEQFALGSIFWYIYYPRAGALYRSRRIRASQSAVRTPIPRPAT